MKPWFTTKQAAMMLNRTESTVVRLCRANVIVAYKAVIKAYEKEYSILVIPQREFNTWLKKLKPREVKAVKKGFTMNCFSFACTGDARALKSIVITENKHLGECPICKNILVKRSL